MTEHHAVRVYHFQMSGVSKAYIGWGDAIPQLPCRTDDHNATFVFSVVPAQGSNTSRPVGDTQMCRKELQTPRKDAKSE